MYFLIHFKSWLMNFYILVNNCTLQIAWKPKSLALSNYCLFILKCTYSYKQFPAKHLSFISAVYNRIWILFPFWCNVHLIFRVSIKYYLIIVKADCITMYVVFFWFVFILIVINLFNIMVDFFKSYWILYKFVILHWYSM